MVTASLWHSWAATRLRARDSTEQALSQILAFGRSRRNGKEARAGVLQVFGERVVLGQAVLHRHVVRARVNHKGYEEQARIQTAQAIGSICVVEPAAQHLHAVVGRGMREGHM